MLTFTNSFIGNSPAKLTQTSACLLKEYKLLTMVPVNNGLYSHGTVDDDRVYHLVKGKVEMVVTQHLTASEPHN